MRKVSTTHNLNSDGFLTHFLWKKLALMGETLAGNWPKTVRRMRRRAPQPVGRHSNRYEQHHITPDYVGREEKETLLKAAMVLLGLPSKSQYRRRL